MKRVYFMLTLLANLSNILESTIYHNKEIYTNTTNNFQSLYDLVNPSIFLQNFNVFVPDKDILKPDIDYNGLLPNINLTDIPLLETSSLGPPLFLTKPDEPNPPLIQIQTVRGPQSLTIFMNFQNDGTTSLQVLNENNLNFFDLGNCRHGQIFHALTGLCVDLFCIEGYTLTSQGCFPDTKVNTTSSYKEPIKKPSPEMLIEITIALNLCTYIKGHNDTLECNTTEAMSNYENENFQKDLQLSLSSFLNIDYQRISNMTIVSHKVANQTIMKEINNTIESMFTDEYQDIGLKYDLSTMEKNEYLKVKFLLLDALKFSNETTNRESITLFYFMVMHSLDKTYLNIIKDRNTYLSDVIAPDQENHGWCNSKGDKQLRFRENFHILASFDNTNAPSYYIYVNETDTLYGSGYFQLTFLLANVMSSNSKTIFKAFKDNIWNFNSEKYQIISEHYSKSNETDYLNINLSLTDVTSMFLTNGPSANEVVGKELLTVCSIAPKIRVQCENFKTIRIKLCELEKLSDGTYCSVRTKFCYTIDEYQFEYENNNENATRFITVCEQFKSKRPKKAIENQDNLNYLRKKFNLMVVLPGWVSVGALLISLIAMIGTLVTYMLFSELRNVPGWNIINLNFALILAQLTFLFGSFFNHFPLFCFIISLLTHYGFVASFFWMNIIAFDLHRNFREKSSHVLLLMITVKDRLPKYAAYAWLSPLLIVIIGLIVDLSVKETKLNAPFRPCYADYLPGCSRTSNYSNQTQNSNTTYFTLKNEFSTILDDDDSCNLKPDYSTLVVLSSACWIRNGKANLVFFGMPILIIIIVNAIYFILTIYNIRQKKNKQKQNSQMIRRFSRAKLPIDRDVKFYIRISSIMGFQWITGFFLTFFKFSFENTTHEIIYQILIYVFILSGSSVGLFIFIAFICKHETKELYRKFFKENIICRFFSKNQKISDSLKIKKSNKSENRMNNRIRQISNDSLPSTSSSTITNGVNRSSKSSIITTVSCSKDSFNSSLKSIMIEEVNENKEKSDFKFSDEVFLSDEKSDNFKV